MKYAIIFLITLYQNSFAIMIENILGTHYLCRFSPSCSEFAKRSILKHGVLKGVGKSVVRVFSCNPFVYESSVTL